MKKWFAMAAVALTTSVAILMAEPAKEASPALEPKADADGFYSLFDGKTLNGWKIGGVADGWKAENGELITTNGPSHLFYEGPLKNHDFKNFHVKAEVMTKPHANSGIYFHTTFQDKGFPNQGFECQVNETHGDKKKTGGLYNVKDVMDVSPAEDGKWFLYEIIVEGKHVVIKIDGKVTCDWTEAEPAVPVKGMPGRFIQHGTFALQGHDPKSETHFKSIVVKPLDD